MRRSQTYGVHPAASLTRPEESAGRGRMAKISALGLGILAGVGGFVDFGGIITSLQAGAQFRYALIWTLVVGVIGFAVYAEIAGRVAIATGRTMYDVIRDRLGARVALIPLIATTISHVLTVLVELAGMTLVISYITHISYLLLIPLAALLLAIFVWKVDFEIMDNVGALIGLTMLVAVVTMIASVHDWIHMAISLFHPSMATAHPVALYLFSAISLLGAYMTPYQFDFYSAGALEEEWGATEFVTNRVVSTVGTGFGALITLGLTGTAAALLYPHHQAVSGFADAVLPFRESLGAVGVAFFLVGTFAVSFGAGLEATMSGSYAVMQYFGFDWGKKGTALQEPLFYFGLLGMLVLAVLIGETRVNPLLTTTLTMAIGAVALPFNFLPLLIVANDRDYMGDSKNAPAMNIVACIILGLLILVTVGAIPLLILSGSY